MSWTTVAKPTSSLFTGTYFPGNEIYDDSTIAYDSSTTYYDSINYGQYTNVETPSVNWNLDCASYVGAYDISGQTARPEWVFFKPDGTKMYIGDGSGGSDNKVYEYTLSTAWDLDTLSYVQEFDVGVGYIDAGYFRADGKKMYLNINGTGAANDNIREYNLLTAWDISTATLLNTFNHATSASGIYFSPDGTQMFLPLYTMYMQQYELLIPWNVTTAILRDTIDLRGYADYLLDGLYFKPDGSRMYLCDADENSRVFEFLLPVPWDITLATLANVLTIVSDYETYSSFFKNDGGSVFITSTSGDVLQYNMVGSWTNVSKPT
jgi:WD40 repeat protein